MGDLDGALADGDEAAVGQRREHVGHVPVALQVELGEWSAAAHRHVALALADQAQHDGAHERLARVGDASVGALGQPRDGAVNAAGLAVGGQGERVVLPLLPELEQGGGQQRQRARLALHVVDQRVGQLRLHPQPHPAGGQLDDTPQLRGLHRADQHVVRPQQLGKSRVGGEPPVEVGAQRDHYDRSTLWISGCASKGVGERSALGFGAAGGEQLLELVDNEEQALVGGQRVEGLDKRIPRSRDEGAAKLVQRPLAGTQQQTPPPLAARQGSCGEGREKAGADERRLAAARRADDAQEAGADEAGDELGDEPLAAEEVLGIHRLEARETLERAFPLSGHAGRGGRVREGPRLLAHELEVDHLAGQLGLDLALVAPATGGTGGDIDEQAVRLVDRDRERRPGELSAARVAPLWLLRQRPRDHGVERRRQLRPPCARRRRFSFEVREHDRHVRVTPKRWLPDETLVEHAAERVDVRPPVDLLTGDLLGGDVVDGAHQLAVRADSGLLGDPLREAEVRQVDVVGAVGAGARVEEHVGGLHIPVHETARMGRIQGACQLCEDADCVRRVQTAALQALVQVTPLDVAHGDEEEIVGRPSLIDRDDVRMVDRRGQLRLVQEAVTERFVHGEAGGQQLQRDAPLEPQILGQVDDAHATPAQQGLDPIAGELGADPRVLAHLHVRILAFGDLQNDKTSRGSL